MLCVDMIAEGARAAQVSASVRVALIVVGSVSLPAVGAWLGAALWAAQRARPGAAAVVDFCYPLGLVAPVLALALPAAGAVPRDSGAVARLCVCGLAFLGAHAATWWALRLVWRARLRLEGGEPELQRSLPPAAAPLLEGAWVRKRARRGPESLRSRRWVFAQLSLDGGSLRWGWRSYVFTYLVEHVAADPTTRQLTLSFALDKPLVFLFDSQEALLAWHRGLRELLPRLEAFEHVPAVGRASAKEARHASFSLDGSASPTIGKGLVRWG